ncbi:MAG: hypothetical protein R2798_06240 [Chitinophagales bacterium]
MFNAQEYNILLANRHARQISNEEIIIPAFNYRNEFVLTKIKF